MKYGVIIAARTGSTRLPGKAILPLGGMPMIVFLIRRLKESRFAGGLFLATTTLASDNKLVEIVEKEGIPVFRGDENDVVKRFVDAADYFNIEYVVRVTGDCPFVDAETLDHCLAYCNRYKTFDLATTKSFFPVGIDYEIYNAHLMSEIHKKGILTKDEKEHLTLYLYNHSQKFNIHNIKPSENWVCKDRDFTVDTEEDYNNAVKCVESFGRFDFNIKKLLYYK